MDKRGVKGSKPRVCAKQFGMVVIAVRFVIWEISELLMSASQRFLKVLQFYVHVGDVDQ